MADLIRVKIPQLAKKCPKSALVVMGVGALMVHQDAISLKTAVGSIWFPWLLYIIGSSAAFLDVFRGLRTAFLFVWACFLRPFIKPGKKSSEQRDQLDAFYQTQATVYDTTRSHLLEGREHMLQLLASHLKAQNKHMFGASKLRIWVDVGGGTGWNIEKMDDYLPLDYFDEIYLVDLCEPLLEVARKRFAARGWKNVHVLCQDATQLALPCWEDGTLTPNGSITAITLSYSLSMIPSFYSLIDRCEELLDPEIGLIGAVDFYTSRDVGSQTVGCIGKRNSWMARWFWECWFEFDHVHLHSSRRDYLEHRMDAVKIYNGRNNFLNSWFIQIPYYIYLGRSRVTFRRMGAPQNGDGLWTPDSGVFVSPYLSPSKTKVGGDFSIGPSAMDETAEHAPQAAKSWRVPFVENATHRQFRTHIYGWTWEDPEVDVKKLGINESDHVLAITSAGDNALHYALAANCERVHAVDMNPRQGHILELKLAAIQSLEYNDFWLMFGEGRHPDFDRLLTVKISPYLSSAAYAYWKTNAGQFKRNFYYRGYSGWALRLAHLAFFLAGVSGDVERVCQASSMAEQQAIFDKRIRPVMMSRFMLRTLLGNPVFHWHALGVPRTQMECFLADGTVEDFVKASLDPIPSFATLKDDNYFFFLCLNGRYSRASCPAYLKPEGFRKLKSPAVNGALKLHTDTILNVLKGFEDEILTKIIVMDSMDWFDRIPVETPLCGVMDEATKELDLEILEMQRCLKEGGVVAWRSAGKHPWYCQRFELAGFKVEPIDIRERGRAIDRVNMYASFWRAEKVSRK